MAILRLRADGSGRGSGERDGLQGHMNGTGLERPVLVSGWAISQ